jgi:hypothetical protein
VTDVDAETEHSSGEFHHAAEPSVKFALALLGFSLISVKSEGN